MHPHDEDQPLGKTRESSLESNKILRWRSQIRGLLNNLQPPLRSPMENIDRGGGYEKNRGYPRLLAFRRRDEIQRLDSGKPNLRKPGGQMSSPDLIETHRDLRVIPL